MRSTLAALALVLLLPAAVLARVETPLTWDQEFGMSSPAFVEGGAIPPACTCTGKDQSPPLLFHHVPGGIRSLVLILDDPDAPGGSWTHWVVYDIPGTSSGLPQNLPRTAQLSGLATQGLNSWGKVGYGGPCPPAGTHHYVFRLYALNVVLGLPGGATRERVEEAMAGHVVARVELVGVFGR